MKNCILWFVSSMSSYKMFMLCFSALSSSIKSHWVRERWEMDLGGRMKNLSIISYASKCHISSSTEAKAAFQHRNIAQKLYSCYTRNGNALTLRITRHNTRSLSRRSYFRQRNWQGGTPSWCDGSIRGECDEESSSEGEGPKGSVLPPVILDGTQRDL